MKRFLITVALVVVVITLAHAKTDVRRLFSGQSVPMGPFDTNLAFGNLTAKYAHLEPADVKATGNAVILIGLLRRMFGVGIYPMPPLDPYYNKKLKPIVIDNDSMFSGKVNLMSVTIHKGKHFQLDDFEMRMKTGRTDFTVKFPSLYFVLDFHADLLFGHLIPVVVSGQLRVDFEQLTVSGAMQAEPRILEGFGTKRIYQLIGAKLHLMATDAKVSFVGMQLENDLLQSIDRAEQNSEFTKWMLSIRRLLENSFMDGTLLQMNEILRSLSTAQVMSFLLPSEGEAFELLDLSPSPVGLPQKDKQ